MIKKITVVLLMLSFFMNIVSKPAHAHEQSYILSNETPAEVTDYANDVIDQHFFSVSQDVSSYGFDNTDLFSYKLGNSFTVYNIIDETIIYSFVLLSNSNIVGLLEVYDDGEEMVSSLSRSYAKELTSLLNQSSNVTYKLISDGNSVYAISNDNEISLIYSLTTPSNKIDIDYANIYIDNGEHILHDYNTIQENATIIYHSPITRADVNRPISYKTLSVKGVRQGHNQCWAATCAALINYYKGYSLTALSVAQYVFPSNPYQGGTWTNMKKAYNHWNLYPVQYSRVSFTTIKSKINSYKPMHLGLTGHSVALVGYEDWADRDMLILLEPNGGVLKSVQLKSNGNFNYYISGNDSWHYTRMF